MKGFLKCHAWVNFAYLIILIIFVSVFKNPALIISSLLFNMAYIKCADKKAGFLYVAVIILSYLVINPFISHEGMTIITYLPDGNPITKESVIYGFFAGCMLSGVILAFYLFRIVITSEKFLYVTRGFAPSLALTISMVFAFIPRLSREFSKALMWQKTLGGDIKKGSLLKRVKILSDCVRGVFSYEIEKAYELSASMKRRGYDSKEKRTREKIKMRKKDKAFMFLILASALVVGIGWWMGEYNFSYYPYIKAEALTTVKSLFFAGYILYLAIPLIINLTEVKKWKN